MGNLAEVQRVEAKYGGRIADLFGVSQRPIAFSVADLNNGNAAETNADAGTIVLDRTFLKNASREDLRGAIIHEMTHAYRVGYGTDQAETLADYARYKLNPREADYWKPSQAVLDYSATQGDTQMTTPSPSASPSPAPSPTDPGAPPGTQPGYYTPPPTQPPATAGGAEPPASTGGTATPPGGYFGPPANPPIPNEGAETTSTGGGKDWFGKQASDQDPWLTRAYTMYVNLWGEPPPEKWLTTAQDSGMNLWELEQAERAKPAFMHTKTAQDEAATYMSQVASLLGAR